MEGWTETTETSVRVAGFAARNRNRQLINKQGALLHTDQLIPIISGLRSMTDRNMKEY
jgi:hypothetical protein